MIRHCALALLLTVAAPLCASAAGAGTAEGKVTVEGKAHKLTHAYAIATKSTTGEAFYKVILADVAIGDKELGLFPDVFVKEINAGKIHAMQISIEASGAVYATDLYDSEGWPRIKEPNKLELTTFDKKTVAGRIHLDKPYRDMGGTYQYDVKFSAPLRPESDFLP